MATSTAERDAVTWDLSSYFPSFNGPEMVAFKEALSRDVAASTAKARALGPLTAANAADWEALFLAYEDQSARIGHVYSFVSCLSSADAANEAYQKELGALSTIGAEMTKLDVELGEALKRADEKTFAAFRDRPAFEGARFHLERTREDALKQMSPEMEGLAADLGIDGISGWSRLYDTVAGKLSFEMKWPDGRVERIPMARRRAIMEDADAAVRKAAFEGGNAAWRTVEDTCAAALNHIGGTRHTLNKRRGVDHFLDVALFQSRISRKTLDAMMEAIHGCGSVARRAAKAKGRALGQQGIGYMDIGAQLRLPDTRKLRWDEGCRLVHDSFAGTMPDIAEYFDMTLEKRWVESEPRAGKRPGAYCTSSRITRESRIYMTFEGSMGDVRTLAHEVGHAFHNWVMRDMRSYARSYPMTLAESASTFAEMILTEGTLRDPAVTDAQKAQILNMELSEAIGMLLDIPVRYEFEKAFYEERAKGEVGVTRLKEIMRETQDRVFGDALAGGGHDEMFWASKLHFYIAGVTFYNFPYTFGYLLSRGLFALFQKEGAAFIPKYRDFLRLTGQDTAENVARKSIGADLEKPDFWREGIMSLEHEIEQFEEVLPRVMGLN